MDNPDFVHLHTRNMPTQEVALAARKLEHYQSPIEKPRIIGQERAESYLHIRSIPNPSLLASSATGLSWACICWPSWSLDENRPCVSRLSPWLASADVWMVVEHWVPSVDTAHHEPLRPSIEIYIYIYIYFDLRFNNQVAGFGLCLFLGAPARRAMRPHMHMAKTFDTTNDVDSVVAPLHGFGLVTLGIRNNVELATNSPVSSTAEACRDAFMSSVALDLCLPCRAR